MAISGGPWGVRKLRAILTFYRDGLEIGNLRMFRWFLRLQIRLGGGGRGVTGGRAGGHVAETLLCARRDGHRWRFYRRRRSRLCVCPMLACFVGLSSLGANQDCNDSFCESMVAPPLFAALQRHAAALTMHLGRSGLARYRAVSVAIDTPTGPEPPRHRFRPICTVRR